MSDIDYDELDRAVNSLSGKPDNSNAGDSVTVNTNAPIPPAVEPSIVPNPTPTPTAPDSAQAVAIKRSSGRFMDVMHPSSDMRPAQVAPRPASPVANLTMPVTSPDNSVEPKAGTDASSMPAATGSPFLPDTKVEKRPLGAFTDSSAGQSEDNLNTDKPIGKDTPLPPELQDDLLLVETSEEIAEPATPPIPAFASKPDSDSTPQAAGSILQQYVEKAEAPVAPTASIFEIGSLKPAKKKPGKKSGWLVVLWILILIILGAGAGAAVYFYVLR